jgi:hypothetical protein
MRMRNSDKETGNLDKALDALREGYEQAADHNVAMPEPKEGKELSDRRWPRLLSYLMGVVALFMVAAALFLFNMERKNSPTTNVVNVELMVETAVPITVDPLAPTPVFSQTIPSLNEKVPSPPLPTAWPTPPIAPNEPSD